MSTAADHNNDRRPRFTFGDHVRKARKRVGMTQAQFAAALGDDVSEKNIDSWESDRNRPRDIVAMSARIEDIADLDRGWTLGFFDGGSPDTIARYGQVQHETLAPVVDLALFRRAG